MLRLRTVTLAASAALLSLAVAAAPAAAGNGHIIHGVGAVSSSLGGAGVALPGDVLGALSQNPALLSRLEEGHQLSFSIELAQAEPTLASEVQTPFGPFSGRTEDDSDLAAVPAFGWSRNPGGGRLAYGVGFLGLAGFGADFPQDPSNPILAPQPQGFGAAFARYQLMRIPFAVSWTLSESVSVGASLNLGVASLEAQPFGGTTPDCSSPTDCFFPSLGEDTAFGAGVQVGVFWQASDTFSVGANFSSEQSFEEFRWNTTVANPNLPSFGTGRVVRFGLDFPQTWQLGVAWTPTDRWSFALDGRRVEYSSTDGFEAGFDRRGVPRGLGWDDIDVLAFGVQYRLSDGVALRAGYNRPDSPIDSDSAFFNVASPAVFEDRISVGAGFRLYGNLTLDLGYYHVFESEVSGPFQSPIGPIPGTEVTETMEMDSFLAAFSFGF